MVHIVPTLAWRERRPGIRAAPAATAQPVRVAGTLAAVCVVVLVSQTGSRDD